MKKGRRVKRQRRFSESFKKSRVGEYERGEFSILELSKLYKISQQALYNWVYKYSSYNEKQVLVVEEKSSSTKKLKDYERRISELERLIGQKQIRIDYLEKLIELADEKWSLDIEKNSGSQRLNGSGKIAGK